MGEARTGRARAGARGLLATLACLGLMGGTATGAGARTPGATPVRIALQLGWRTGARSAGYYLASDRGYYAAEGLDVRILAGGDAGGGAGDAAPVVGAGGAEFGTGTAAGLLRARDAGLPLVEVAQLFQAPSLRLVALRAGPARTPRDLSGRAVGVRSPDDRARLRAWTRALGANAPTGARPVAIGAGLGALLSGRVAAAYASSYDLAAMDAGAGPRASDLLTLDDGTAGPPALEDGLFALSSYLGGGQDLATRFLRASLRGWQDAASDPAAAGAAAEAAGAPGGPARAAAQAVAALVLSGTGVRDGVGYIDPAAFTGTGAALLRAGALRQPPSPDAYDGSYWHLAEFGRDSRSYEVTGPETTLAGGAIAARCLACFGGAKVRFLGYHGTARVRVAAPATGTYTLAIYYMDAHTPRRLVLAVDGGQPVSLACVPSGSWLLSGVRRTTVRLHRGQNTLDLSNPGDWAPDLDAVVVSA